MTRRTIGILCALTVGASPALAQSTKDKLLAVEAGLNDPSTIVRLSTLSDALSDDTRAVREYAMNQAFTSSDATMRSLAVNEYFKSRKSLSVSISKSPEFIAEEQARAEAGENLRDVREARTSYTLLETFGPASTYVISNYDEGSGAVTGICLTNTGRPDERYTITGTVTGDSFTFQQYCNVIGFIDKCNVELELSDDAPEFVGSMQCDDALYPATARIKLN